MFGFIINLYEKESFRKKAHSIFIPEMFNLNDVLADIFGKNGRKILLGISSSN